jgi:hypothetical protein
VQHIVCIVFIPLFSTSFIVVINLSSEFTEDYEKNTINTIQPIISLLNNCCAELMVKPSVEVLWDEVP